jgi:hypothetical protein
MITDFYKLRTFLDAERLSRMSKDQGVHLRGLVDAVAMGTQLNTGVRQYPLEGTPNVKARWRTEALDAIVTVMRHHPDFTDVNPAHPIEFWRK